MLFVWVHKNTQTIDTVYKMEHIKQSNKQVTLDQLTFIYVFVNNDK